MPRLGIFPSIAIVAICSVASGCRKADDGSHEGEGGASILKGTTQEKNFAGKHVGVTSVVVEHRLPTSLPREEADENDDYLEFKIHTSKEKLYPFTALA